MTNTIMFGINNFLLELSRRTKFSIDKINFVFCMLLCLPLGMLFRIVFHPRRVSASARRLLGLVWGLALSWFCFSVVFVSAGIAREESHLTDEQRKEKLK